MARKRRPTALLRRWYAAQEALGWSAEQMGAFIGVSKGAWNSWKREHYNPGVKMTGILQTKVVEIEELATRPSVTPPPQPLSPKEPPKEKQKRQYHVLMNVPTLKRIMNAITFSNDNEDPEGHVKLIIEGKRVIGAEYVVQIIA